MNKHRLELFSDGVFAIVLTVLVLDLRVPAAHFGAAFFEIVPALLVHAASFLVVASLWMAHHGVLARVTEIRTSTLRLNSAVPVLGHAHSIRGKERRGAPHGALGRSPGRGDDGVLHPFPAHYASERPLDDRRQSEPQDLPRNQVARVTLIGTADLACAALAWLSPWPAYAATVATAIFLLGMPSPADMEQRANAKAG